MLAALRKVERLGVLNDEQKQKLQDEMQQAGVKVKKTKIFLNSGEIILLDQKL